MWETARHCPRKKLITKMAPAERPARFRVGLLVGDAASYSGFPAVCLPLLLPEPRQVAECFCVIVGEKTPCCLKVTIGLLGRAVTALWRASRSDQQPWQLILVSNTCLARASLVGISSWSYKIRREFLGRAPTEQVDASMNRQPEPTPTPLELAAAPQSAVGGTPPRSPRCQNRRNGTSPPAYSDVSR